MSSSTSPSQQLDQADALNRQGVALKKQQKHEAAAECYRRALALQPAFAEAHFNLGILCRDIGRVAEAVSCFQQAAAIRPDVLAIHLQLAQSLAADNRLHDAEQVFSELANQHPASADVHFGLANVYFGQGRLDRAQSGYEAAIERNSAWPEPLVNLGNTLREQGKEEAAEAAYRRAIQLDGRAAAALTNLGQLLRSRGELVEALEYCNKAVSCDPRLWEAQVNLGNLCVEMGLDDQAVKSFQQAVDLQPKNAESHVLLGQVLDRCEQVNGAAACYERALRLDPTSARAAQEVGNLLCRIGDVSRGREFYELAAHVDTDDPLAELRVSVACPLVFQSAESIESYYVEAMQTAQRHAGADIQFPLAHVAGELVSAPFNAQFLAGNLRHFKEAVAGIYERYFGDGAGSLGRDPDECRRSLGGRPRIGFVVTRSHEKAFLRSLGSVVKQIDPDLFEVCVVCSELGVSRLRGAFDARGISLVAYPERFDLAARAIASAKFDLLCYWEIGTDPMNYFLPFLRLAAVQCTSWGIQVTSGIPMVDYYLSSDVVEAAGAADHYSEELLLADSLLTCQQVTVLPVDRPDRGRLGLPVEGHLYGCLQNLGKFHPDFDYVLGEVLRRDGLGRLVLVRDRYGKAASLLEQRFRAAMPDVVDRILFLPALSREEYLQVLACCDVVLDPLHFGGVNTTFDAISLEKPIICLPTDQQRGRFTAGCLQQMGVLQTVADSIEDYIGLAVRFGTDFDSRRQIRAMTQDRKGMLFECPKAVQEHERMFQEMLARVR